MDSPGEPRRLEAAPLASAVFDAIWRTLVDILGAPTATTVVRRSARNASEERPTLGQLSIRRAALDYETEVPRAWREASGDGLRDVEALSRELCIVLQQLTGVLVLRALNDHPSLRTLGWFLSEDR
ncbi:MAG: hypothetical protein Q8O67_22850 [Deltaproteobacteria bacterium]|nr:hypothetical protein [Deltaproteobacteria bacterium]